MKKISFALLASLSMAGVALAQTPDNGIVMTHDTNVVAQIEQHARDVQAQAPVLEDQATAVQENAPRKATLHRHHHSKNHSQPTKDQAGE